MIISGSLGDSLRAWECHLFRFRVCPSRRRLMIVSHPKHIDSGLSVPRTRTGRSSDAQSGQGKGKVIYPSGEVVVTNIKEGEKSMALTDSSKALLSKSSVVDLPRMPCTFIQCHVYHVPHIVSHTSPYHRTTRRSSHRIMPRLSPPARPAACSPCPPRAARCWPERHTTMKDTRVWCRLIRIRGRRVRGPPSAKRKPTPFEEGSKRTMQSTFQRGFCLARTHKSPDAHFVNWAPWMNPANTPTIRRDKCKGPVKENILAAVSCKRTALIYHK